MLIWYIQIWLGGFLTSLGGHEFTQRNTAPSRYGFPQGLFFFSYRGHKLTVRLVRHHKGQQHWDGGRNITLTPQSFRHWRWLAPANAAASPALIMKKIKNPTTPRRAVIFYITVSRCVSSQQNEPYHDVALIINVQFVRTDRAFPPPADPANTS